ncbi:BZ3500_MvSof-1268-A1-R1_Chr7-1g09107 [Microbotryum saponariae]|uniref:BZ3500_MvSof-1268-A1-R1_Chr7-1g09107 protein n=1 Tax=Microbotryum saponariae TaxID=289078 RepID=A0A2X0N1B3_9BASI|nr:BZ3501_MvSof-1269-A2-R1_Chr7-1g08812 [Microbotryum saponariae]SDA02815.1 BZ3500_MvSof-1268-A1-R1_Chr7-1g09107 [Microbotryum saponariae]
MSDPAAQDAAATLSRVANSGAPIASTSSSAVLAAAALMAGSNPSASTGNNTSQDAETSDVAIPDPTLTAVASPNAQMPANYNKARGFTNPEHRALLIAASP